MPSISTAAKACTKCRETKTIDQFYACHNGVLGRSSWCKLCMIARKKSSTYRAVHNKWLRQPRVRQITRKAIAKYDANPDNRNKLRARWAVNAAIRAGRLVRPKRCALCRRNPGRASDGRSLLRADHYSGYEEENWLTVRFICSDCDGEEEKRRGFRKKR